MALFSYPVCTWLCQYVNMGVRKWLEKSAEKQKYKMRKTANPLSRKAFRAVSFSATKDMRSDQIWSLRFFLPYIRIDKSLIKHISDRPKMTMIFILKSSQFLGSCTII